jgi:hypothetical protein
MRRQLIAEHRMIGLAEHHERLIDRVQGFDRTIRGDLDDCQHVVSIGMSPTCREVARDGDRLDTVLPAFVESSDAAQRDREVSVRAHCRGAARGRTGECGGVVSGSSSWVREAHGQVTEGHGCRGMPGSVLQALGDVLGESKGLRRARKTGQSELELRLRQMQIQLFSKTRASWRGGERTRSIAQLRLCVVAAAVEGRQNGSLDGKTRGIERVPGTRGTRQ